MESTKDESASELEQVLDIPLLNLDKLSPAPEKTPERPDKQVVPPVQEFKEEPPSEPEPVSEDLHVLPDPGKFVSGSVA